ncbi:hypothetical protein DMA11_24595 [Marinilabiliaceae bacterium JC017]|nr:hypothetical protein DMA11_24595 [Marinilabiliaceae bacterium JC017]
MLPIMVNWRDLEIIGEETIPGTAPPWHISPNPLGMYDMAGNRPEWVLDWDKPYSKEPQINPAAFDKGYEKVVRGFGGGGPGELYRRGFREPDCTGAGTGVRCVANSTKAVR